MKDNVIHDSRDDMTQPDAPLITMVSLEDIFSFMKQDKVDRAEQRKQDMLERAQQREEDLNMIKKLINEGVRAEVLSALEPICRRQEELEDKH